MFTHSGEWKETCRAPSISSGAAVGSFQPRRSTHDSWVLVHLVCGWDTSKFRVDNHQRSCHCPEWHCSKIAHNDQVSKMKIQVHVLSVHKATGSWQATTLLMIQVGCTPMKTFRFMFHSNGSCFTNCIVTATFVADPCFSLFRLCAEGRASHIHSLASGVGFPVRRKIIVARSRAI